jgi:glyoxylase-like metal-dependent hydrolase (beta-lactamase superfamily II)
MSARIDRALATLRSAGPTYEVLALRYGTCTTTRAHSFLGYELYHEPDGPQGMDFCLWVIRNAERTIVVDTGFAPSVAARRQRSCLIAPVDALELAGVTPAAVRDVVLTHLHYDHTGNMSAFTDARFHVQSRELDFWFGPYAVRGQFAGLVERPELASLAKAVLSDRVERVEGDAEIAPGVIALWTGGHTPGHQILAVRAPESVVVLASDAMHFYEELDRDRPFALVSDVQAAYAAYDVLRELQAGGAAIVAGHDPCVFDRFPRLAGPAAEIAVTVAAG